MGDSFLSLSSVGGLNTGLSGLTRANEVSYRASNAVSQQQKAHNTAELDGSDLSPAKKKQIDDAATQFEALLLHQMFQSMWNTVPSEGSLMGSKEEGFYRDMYTEGLANEVSKGAGLGIKGIVAKEMYKQESRIVKKGVD